MLYNVVLPVSGNLGYGRLLLSFVSGAAWDGTLSYGSHFENHIYDTPHHGNKKYANKKSRHSIMAWTPAKPYLFLLTEVRN